MENTISKKGKNKEEYKIPRWVAVCLKVYLYILLVLVTICVIICLPDLILYLRNLLSIFLPICSLPITKNDVITIDNYIIMILTVCSCVVTAMLTYVAFMLSKSLGNIQFCEQKAKKMLWACKVEKAFSSNFDRIHTWKTTQLSVQMYNDAVVEQYVINLYTTKVINSEEREVLINCINNFNLFFEKLQTDTTTATLIADSMISQHLEITSNGFKYNKTMQAIMAKLEEIGKEDA